ncbi:hypothetical protein [Chondromyces crocatus]|uniref:Uncharacterized protein n=1 Tax=Chondromyces crocatus TaxID=52 RepID=A0A0K1EIH9_CHOCO|nr:hypothetical protein [Chondromyces crocatus]AKT40659.1 uncharacterized protein CMC5_048150 [Chondromyces crocatus]
MALKWILVAVIAGLHVLAVVLSAMLRRRRRLRQLREAAGRRLWEGFLKRR